MLCAENYEYIIIVFYIFIDVVYFLSVALDPDASQSLQGHMANLMWDNRWLFCCHLNIYLWNILQLPPVPYQHLQFDPDRSDKMKLNVYRAVAIQISLWVHLKIIVYESHLCLIWDMNKSQNIKSSYVINSKCVRCGCLRGLTELLPPSSVCIARVFVLRQI